MIKICLQKTPLHSPKYFTESDEVLLSSLVKEYIGDLYDHSLVMVGDQYVDPSQYENTVIENGDIVYLSVRPQDPISAIASWGWTQWLTAASLALSAYSGYMAWRASGLESDVNDNEKKAKIDGLRNGPRKYEAIPLVLGQHRVTPDWIAQPYSEIVGNEQYYHLLMCAGHGPLSLEDFKIGDTPVEEYTEVDVRVSDGFHEPSQGDVISYHQNGLHNFWPNDVVQEAINVELDYETPVSRTSAVKTNNIIFDFYFPGGVFYTGDSGKKDYAGVQLDIEITEQDSSDTYKIAKYKNINTSSTTKYQLYSGDVLYDTVTGNYFVFDNGWGPAQSGGDGEAKLRGNEINGHPWTYSIAASHIKRRDVRNKTVSILNTLSSSTYDRVSYTVVDKESKDFYESVKHNPNEVVNGSTESEIFKTFDVTVTKKNPPDTDTFERTTSNVVWQYLSSTRPISESEFALITAGGTNPLNASGYDKNPIRPALIYVKIRATNQLSGMLDKFNCLATSCVPVDFNAEWREAYKNGLTFKETKNPAELYRWVIQGPVNLNSLLNDKVNLEVLEDWRDFCNTEGFEASAFIREQDTLQSLLNKIAYTGRAEFSFVDGKYGVSVKEPKSIPVQVFTNKNSYNFSSARAFPEDTDGIKYEFANENINYEQDEGYYFNPDKPLSEREGLYDSVEIPFVTKPELATRHARFSYFERRLQREVYTLNADVEALKCTRGDLVYVQNDIIDVGLGAGRVVSVDNSVVDNRIIYIDEDIDLVNGDTYALIIRRVTGEIHSVTTTYNNGGFNIGVMTSETGDLVSYGTPGLEVLPCIVNEISYSDDLNASLTLVNYSDDLFNTDADEVPQYQSYINTRDSYKPPVPPRIRVPFNPERNAQGISRVLVQATNSQISNIRFFQIEARSDIRDVNDDDFEVNSDWRVVGVIPSSEGYLDVETGLDNYWEFRARAIGQNDLMSPYSNVVKSSIPTGATGDVQSLTLQELTNTPKTPNADLSTIVSRIVIPSDLSFDHAIIDYRKQGEDTWFVAGKSGNQYPDRVDIVVNSDGSSYEVRATTVSITGVESESSVVETITVSDVEQDNSFVPMPNVKGLELFEQGNDTEFVGRDPQFVWRKTSEDEFVTLANENGVGIDQGGFDLYFRDYRVQIYNQNDVLVHEDFTTDTFFTYSYSQNREDYKRVEGSEGAYRQFRIEVIMRGRNAQDSKKAAKLTVSNPAPNLPAINSYSGFNNLSFDYVAPQDRDFVGIKMWMSSDSGFIPSDSSNLVHDLGQDRSIVVGGLEQGTTYYFVYQSYDDFGPGDISGELSITTKDGLDLTGLSGWAYEIDPVDRTFIENNLADDAVPSEKVVNLTAAKITTGTLNATETITAEGLIRAVDDVNSPDLQVGIGPADINGDVYLLWAYNSVDGVLFGVDETGGATFNGAVTITGGSGVSNLSDAGGLATKDNADWSSDITGSGKPEDNADVTSKSQFAPSHAWGFNGGLSGWGSNASANLTANPYYLTYTCTGNDPQLLISGLSIVGGGNTKVRMRMRRRSGTSWDSSLYYVTSGHGHSGSFRKTIPDPTDGTNWVVAEWDMANLTAGGSDWVDNVITGLRFDLLIATGDELDIDWIAVGDVRVFSSATAMQYADGKFVEELEPAESGAEKTSGKSLTVLTDRTADNISESSSRKWAAESGATVGANWNTTLSNIPNRITDNATTGLNLTDTYLGYYDGTQFQSYIQNNGNFHFGGTGNNFIDWNGSDLVLAVDRLGSGAALAGSGSVSLGSSSRANANSVSVGINSQAGTSTDLGGSNVSIGNGASSIGSQMVSIGRDTVAGGIGQVGCTSVGWQSSCTSSGCSYGANSSSVGGTAIGQNSSAENGGIALGTGSTSDQTNEIIIGNFSSGSTNSIVLGNSLSAAGEEHVVCGNNTNMSSGVSGGILLGFGANIVRTYILSGGDTVDGSVVLGRNSTVYNDRGTAIGSNATAGASGTSPITRDTTAVGHNSTAGHNRSSAFGYNATTTSANQVRLGTASETVSVPGDIDCEGTITQSSDERKKTNWQDLSEDFLDQLANVKFGTFDRTDKELTQAGVSANDWQKLLPETVHEDAEGFLTMDYGSSALVTCLQLAKEIRELKSEIAKLKGEK